MQPYYSQGNISLYLGDCREVLPTLPRASVDLLLTDPPYGMRFVSGRRQEQYAPIAGDDGSLDVPAAIALALRVLKDHRHLYVFGRSDLSALPLSATAELIWDKGGVGMGDLSLPWGRAHEPIIFAVYGRRRGKETIGRDTEPVRRRRGSVLHCPTLNASQMTRHPTEKPVRLLRELIESSSVMDEIVLDPFAGGGSALVAAQLEGRGAVGIEIDEAFCEIAANRLRQSVLPLEMGA